MYVNPSLRFPADEFGVPLVILPQDVPPGTLLTRHHYYSPEKELLEAGLAGHAVRNCRTQPLPGPDHDAITALGHPRLPSTDAERVAAVALNAAGYLTVEAIDLGSGRPQIGRLDEHVRTEIWEAGVLRVASSRWLRDFLLDHGLKHVFPDDSPAVSELLEYKGPINEEVQARQAILTRKILRVAIERALGAGEDEGVHLSKKYNAALAAGQLPLGSLPVIDTILNQVFWPGTSRQKRKAAHLTKLRLQNAAAVSSLN